MALLGVLETLNNLRKTGIIDDYAIGGGYAVNYYSEPTYTYDLDILVLLNSDAGYHALYEYFGGKGDKIENIYIIIDSTRVQFLPSYISPLFDDAIKKAKKITFKKIPGKVVTVEHLIALLLVSFRPKDKIRILDLVEQADKKKLDEILREFDNGKTPLRQRLAKILGNI